MEQSTTRQLQITSQIKHIVHSFLSYLFGCIIWHQRATAKKPKAELEYLNMCSSNARRPFIQLLRIVYTLVISKM